MRNVDERVQFLTDIGMIKEYNAPLSPERLDLLDDLDVILWTTEHTGHTNLLDHKLVSALRTTREGRFVLAPDGGNDNLLYSMDWGTVLSNRWAIENAVPRFVKAVDGDPATDPNT